MILLRLIALILLLIVAGEWVGNLLLVGHLLRVRRIRLKSWLGPSRAIVLPLRRSITKDNGLLRDSWSKIRWRRCWWGRQWCAWLVSEGVKRVAPLLKCISLIDIGLRLLLGLLPLLLLRLLLLLGLILLWLVLLLLAYINHSSQTIYHRSNLQKITHCKNGRVQRKMEMGSWF